MEALVSKIRGIRRTREFLRMCAACLLLLCAALAAGQGAKVHPDLDPADADADRPQERSAWFMEGRQVQGTNAAELLHRAYMQRLQLRSFNRARSQSLFSIRSTALGSWQSVGPNNLASDPSGFQNYGAVTGRATAIAVDQNDASGNTVYAGGAYGGLWRSTNAAADPASVNWTPLLDSQATLAVGALALKPDTTGASTVLLVGTGEANNSSDSYYGLGILRSTDAGATWALVDTATDATSIPARTVSFEGLAFSRLAFNTAPGKTNQVVAATATSNAALTAAGNSNFARGLYYSSDAGATWNLAFITNDGVNPIAFSSATDVVYSPVTGKFFAALRLQGIYSSSDGGQTWLRLPNQPGGANLSEANCPRFGSIGCPIYRGAIAVRPGTGELYVAYVDGSQTFRGIYRSTDGGVTWSGDLGEAGYLSCGDSIGCGSAQSVYNFFLSAIATGPSSTDLYLGGVNLYRCSLASNASAACNWANITHVYGCSNTGTIAASSHVHPDQHGMVFLAANPRLMYFANDGGIYRSNNGAASDGSCNAANAASWQNLNARLGPMGEFLWISQDGADPGLLLGGTQDNGSPAEEASRWNAVNAGDGGFTEIDPRGNGVWYSANTGVSIQRCTNGAACTGNDFLQVIDNCSGAGCHSNIGGDNSAFYTPYMLDPLDASKIIVGTCRVWRGSSDGSGWPGANNGYALSFNFDTGANTPCGLNHMISALAAGGPPGASGAASVIYAGRNDGHVFVSTAAESGPGSFADRSSTLNSRGFKISGIAVDRSDPSGKTAVAVVMGFAVGHVWRTTNAGVTWSDISGAGPGALPDAPADSVLIDPVNPAHIVVGSDVGVFETNDLGVTWAEVASAMPSVPATRLLMFDGTGVRKLRAATYGRGIWEVALPPVGFFSLQLASGTNTAASAAVGQSAGFNLSLNSINGFSGPVALSCSGVPSGDTCMISPGTVNLAAGASVPISVSVAVQHARLSIPALRKTWLLAIAGVLAIVCGGRRRQTVLVGLIAFAITTGISACGGGNSSSKESAALPLDTGTSVVITATSGTQSQNLSLTLHVQ
ncbi:MAG TPA: sialidase family protein [Candidatus Angelobacter sp.]|nr:sialidase family protein [Candidatus Angelobacter sp.]